MKTMLQVLVVLAGLHLIVVALHQMLVFQNEFPHLDDHSLPNMGPDQTLLGSRALLWGFHPFIAVLVATRLDPLVPAPLVFLFDSVFWAALVLALMYALRHAFHHPSSNAPDEKTRGV